MFFYWFHWPPGSGNTKDPHSNQERGCKIRRRLTFHSIEWLIRYFSVSKAPWLSQPGCQVLKLAGPFLMTKSTYIMQMCSTILFCVIKQSTYIKGAFSDETSPRWGASPWNRGRLVDVIFLETRTTEVPVRFHQLPPRYRTFQTYLPSRRKYIQPHRWLTP